MTNTMFLQQRKAKEDPALAAALRSSSYISDLMALRSGRDMSGLKDAASTGQIFLQSELNKADTRLHFPLEGHTWLRDIPVMRGGGWVDTETAEFVNVFSPNIDGGAEGANDIAVINYNRSQDVYATFGYQRSIRVPLIESLKLAQANKSPNDILDKGVRTDWNKTMDQRVYQGGKSGKPGLVNQTIVPAQTAPNGTQASPGPSWTTKNPVDLLSDINTMAQIIWQNSGYALNAVPNRFGIPASAYPNLLKPMYLNVAGAPQVSVYQNVLNYIKANYWGLAINGETPELFPVPNWLETAGASSSRRIVAYRFSDEFLNFSVLQDIQRMGGPLSLQDGAFVATYIGNTGIVKVLRPTTMLYFDQI